MTTHEKMLLRIYRMRGQFLQYAIEIETLFEHYKAKYFTNDEQKEVELITLILAPRITFENKFQIFKYLVDKYNPEFIAKAPKYSTHLMEIITYRNMFAHFPADFNQSSYTDFEHDESITLVKLKNQKDFGLASKAVISLEGFKQNLKLMQEYAKLIHYITYDSTDTANPPA